MMDNRTIYPSMKSVWAAYALAGTVVVAGMWAVHNYGQDQPGWLYIIPFLALLPAVNMQLKRRMVTLKIQDDHLTLESGFLSRTRRTLDMAKIQDVTVQQTLWQRIMGTGDLMLESAGESGAMAIGNLDRPREIADSIISGSKAAHGQR